MMGVEGTVSSLGEGTELIEPSCWKAGPGEPSVPVFKSKATCLRLASIAGVNPGMDVVPVPSDAADDLLLDSPAGACGENWAGYAGGCGGNWNSGADAASTCRHGLTASASLPPLPALAGAGAVAVLLELFHGALLALR